MKMLSPSKALLIALVAAGCFLGGKIGLGWWRDQRLRLAGLQFLQRVAEGRMEEAYAMMSAQYRAAHPLEAFVSQTAVLRAGGMRQVVLKTASREGDHGTLEGAVVTSRGETAPVALTLGARGPWGWEIAEFQGAGP